MTEDNRIALKLLTFADFSAPSVLHSAAFMNSSGEQIGIDTFASFSDLSHKKTQMLWFYADWCGHCQNMKTEWLHAKKKGRRYADWHDIDCGNGHALAQDMGVRSFPTIKRIKRAQILDFNGKRTSNEFVRFSRRK